MVKETDLTIWPSSIYNADEIKKQAAKKLKLNQNEISVQIIRKSIDSRKKTVYKLRVKVYINEQEKDLFNPVNFNKCHNNKKVIVVGSGPAGLFGAMQLLEQGIKPVVLERGKDVQERRKDLKKINVDQIVNTESNYCFGEGGAGTYSDGKLYTRSTKRGDVKKILNLFVQHGADPAILIEAHPHIGSNNLPKIIKKIRETILENGGEFHFNSKVTDLIIDNKTIKGVVVNDATEFFADAVLLATGHSARDIFYLLDKHKVKLEAKDFAMGVRIEHPQELIDSIQYHQPVRHKNLPASEYSLACQISDRGVYSFCMCPGGILVPATTGNKELVLNGMSVSKRNSPYANSGLVVSVTEKEWHKKYGKYGVFAGLEYQKALEHRAYKAGGETQVAPAQRVTDFVKGKISSTLPDTSYKPGIVSAPVHNILTQNISKRLIRALQVFNSKMKGYYTEEAKMIAPESRTSSPIRIPRDRYTYMHVEIKGLFPAGEGAGYAGGIISAAIDGENCATSISNFVK